MSKQKNAEYQRNWKIRNPENARKQHKEKNKRYVQNHPEHNIKSHRKWNKQNREKIRVYNLIQKHPEQYPLVDKCIFCGEINNLEHGHLDYEDNGYNYVTVCHQCNMWMGL